jgi:membrane-bound lytic murein transglycosylase B
VLLIAVTATAVARSFTRATAGPLVVSGGIPPDPPATGPAPVAGVQKVQSQRVNDWGAAGRFEGWAYRIAARVPIAPRALAAYALGERYAAARSPSCGLSWVTLAAVGAVESAHGQFGGATVAADGTSAPAIIGPPLDGRPGVQAIVDTDHGRYDGDTWWDRAVGPMQFLPSTWRTWGVDGDGDGVARPHDLDDAAATAAVYLCASSATMTTGPGWWTAVTTYNHSDSYARAVLERSNEYANASLR